eukprot:6253023-Alexandrium_andersonii.AAC.1
MSASLVGSEMCIRDSARSGRARRRLPSATSARPPGWLRLRPRRAERAAPVSYTHLTLPTICSV